MIHVEGTLAFHSEAHRLASEINKYKCELWSHSTYTLTTDPCFTLFTVVFSGSLSKPTCQLTCLCINSKMFFLSLKLVTPGNSSFRSSRVSDWTSESIRNPASAREGVCYTFDIFTFTVEVLFTFSNIWLEVVKKNTDLSSKIIPLNDWS